MRDDLIETYKILKGLDKAGRCALPKIPFRGAPCSDAAGHQVPDKEIIQQVHKSITGRSWDDDQKAPYYIYMPESLKGPHERHGQRNRGHRLPSLSGQPLKSGIDLRTEVPSQQPQAARIQRAQAERMRWSLELAQALVVLVLWVCCGSGTGCPCSDRALCEPVTVEHEFEVFVFDVGGKDWKYYDWSKVTTIAAFGPYDPDLLCYAHANQVRVVLRASSKPTCVNIAAGNASVGYFFMPQLVSETMGVFHCEIPGSQVTFNVPWSPDCIDGRCYDFLRIANSCDFLFVMSYDMQSQMWDNCFAKANAPYYQTLSGYSAYINLGIDSRKLVLGVPWYGYDYPCTQFFETGRCVLEKIPFRGAPCSNAAGRQVPYKEIVQHVHKSITGRYWDDEQKVPSYIYMVNNTFHEVWYDDPQSISIKSAIMKKLRLRGIGMWNGNMLNYSDDHFIVKQTEDMWNALCPL
ncbi:di-N-acetylchitobiase-like [Heptranchias perlo]|uniref:di-N-acetylchitobiase-like n=1 Tax=Heptranchias perlo TaxID=212740 RepID=UPI00355A23DB